ncbi:MAG: hypothetical protein E2O52_00120 [Gammaproteobacteria bacterium]|nr:MAG: hypothetical protein E2O52_00120 [Gammaproteobacteria bacterium]
MINGLLESRSSAWRSSALLIIIVCGITACGSGGGVDLAGGQAADPVVLDVPIAYVKRPLPLDDQGNVEPTDARELITFEIGADLYVRERASPSAAERNITEGITAGLGDVRDLEVSYDGSRVIFAMRAQFIENADEEDQPKWNIWEYDLEFDVLTRIMTSDITAEAGHDVAPYYLPDGRIVFSSTRQRQSNAILLDEGKPQFSALDENRGEFAFVLHVMNADGSDIHQVSYNQSHDLDPAVLSDGRIVFTRWDNMGGRNAMHLYTMNPDGTELQLLYGKNSHATGTNGATIQFLQPREMSDGRMMTIVQPFQVASRGADIRIIETADYLENVQANAANAGVLTGPAQSFATINDVRTDGSVSPGGVFGSAYPLWDGTERMFVSWSQCRLVDAAELAAAVLDPALLPLRIFPCTDADLADPALVEADPLFGIWIYDRASDTQLPVLQPEEGIIYADVVAAQQRTLPPVIHDQATTGALDPAHVDAGVGFINIRSIYDRDGVDQAAPDIPALADPAQTTADQRPGRFLRIVKAVSIPDDDVRDFANTAFGRSAGQGMREIIGYVPVEPDGSVYAMVPANIPLAISVLNAAGERVTPRHQSWLQVRPGETLECNGCHENNTGFSHGRADAFDSAYPGALADSLPFPNTVSLYFADFGETMAEARARLSCATDCAEIMPRVDIVYDDVWTDEVAAGRARDASVAYLYNDLTTPAPVSAACQAQWTPICRIVIHYEMHIHPLWAEPRLAPDGITDVTCTVCHSPVDAMAMIRAPLGQLDLTDGPSVEEPDHLRAYRELLFPDNQQFFDLATGTLQDVMIEIGIDPVTGDPILQPVTVAASMSVNGAVSSAPFFSRFSAGASHAGYLSGAELRLVAEWLDIGGQYFNNPFDAPIN